MVEEQNPYFGPADTPASPQPKRVRKLSKMALTGGLVAGLALGGTGVGFAFASAGTSSTPSGASATASDQSTTSTTTPVKGPRGFGGRRGAGPFGAMGGNFGPGAGMGIGMGGIVHGSFTVKSGSGYKTEEIQVGTVSAADSSSVTVKSADGFSATYTVVSSTVVNAQSGGIGSVAKGDSVRITASSVSGKDTATDIMDTTKLQNSRNFFGFGGSRGSTAPSSSGSSTPA